MTIHVVYPAGAFGSTIEYCLRRFTTEFEEVKATISSTGSMHTFVKQLHSTCLQELPTTRSDIDISTILYPLAGISGGAVGTLQYFKNIISTDNVVCVVLPDLSQAIRNQLFGYFKIHRGNPANILRSYNYNYRQWNPGYNSVQDMQRWEQREMLSTSFQGLYDFTDAATYVKPEWSTITPNQLIDEFSETISYLIRQLGLTIDNASELKEFGTDWVSKQKYVLEHYHLLETIVESTVTKTDFQWHPLDLISESLVQYMLLLRGYDIECSNLDTFPCTSNQLAAVLLSP